MSFSPLTGFIVHAFYTWKIWIRKFYSALVMDLKVQGRLISSLPSSEPKEQLSYCPNDHTLVGRNRCVIFRYVDFPHHQEYLTPSSDSKVAASWSSTKGNSSDFSPSSIRETWFTLIPSAAAQLPFSNGRRSSTPTASQASSVAH
jgi:hypothetical protein